MVFEQFNEKPLYGVQKNNKLLYSKSMNCFKGTTLIRESSGNKVPFNRTLL